MQNLMPTCMLGQTGKPILYSHPSGGWGPLLSTAEKRRPCVVVALSIIGYGRYELQQRAMRSHIFTSSPPLWRVVYGVNIYGGVILYICHKRIHIKPCIMLCLGGHIKMPYSQREDSSHGSAPQALSCLCDPSGPRQTCMDPTVIIDALAEGSVSSNISRILPSGAESPPGSCIQGCDADRCQDVVCVTRSYLENGVLRCTQNSHRCEWRELHIHGQLSSLWLQELGDQGIPDVEIAAGPKQEGNYNS